MEKFTDILCDKVTHRKIDDHGFVTLVDVMPRIVPEGRTADFAIVQAARCSTGQGTKTPEEDRELIRYLMRNRHTSPFEMVELKFHCRMPIFVARQWIRHRTAHVNEFSARYAVLKDEFYFPAADQIKSQSVANKQGSGEAVDVALALEFQSYLQKAEDLYNDYKYFVEKGVARETARIALPVSIYTEWYWKIDLHNLFHFLGLRADPHAQAEIRTYAQALLDLIKPICPNACEAFNDYRVETLTFSKHELASLKMGLPSPWLSAREVAEFQAKTCRLTSPIS